MEGLIGRCKSLIEAVNSRLISTEKQRTKVEHTCLGLTCISEEHF